MFFLVGEGEKNEFLVLDGVKPKRVINFATERMSTVEELTDQLQEERRLRAMRDALDVKIDGMIAAAVACRRAAAKKIRSLRVLLRAEKKRTARLREALSAKRQTIDVKNGIIARLETLTTDRA